MAKPSRVTIEMIQDTERLLASGATRKSIAKRFGCSPSAFGHWLKTIPEFKVAVERGQAFFNAAKTDGFVDPKAASNKPLEPWERHPTMPDVPRIPLLIDNRAEQKDQPKGQIKTRWRFVWGYLPRPLASTWEMICAHHENGNDVDLDDLFATMDPHHRQQMFLYAYVRQRFDVSTAMLTVLLTRSDLENWITTDVDFDQAWRDMAWHKKNSYEATLMRACLAGETAAIVFANKTINSSRGYREKVPQEKTNNEPKSSFIPVDELELPLATRVELREAIRRRRLKGADPQ